MHRYDVLYRRRLLRGIGLREVFGEAGLVLEGLELE